MHRVGDAGELLDAALGLVEERRRPGVDPFPGAGQGSGDRVH